MPGVIVPRKTVGEVQRLIEDNEAEVTIELSQGKIRFTIGNVVLTSKLIDGTFPDYGRVIPQNNDKELIVDKKDFEAAVDRVSTISSERGRAVKLALSAGKLVLSVTNPDSGSATEELEVEYASDALDIGFNSRYLLDIAAQIEGEVAVLQARRPRLADAGAGQGQQGRALRADADAGVTISATRASDLPSPLVGEGGARQECSCHTREGGYPVIASASEEFEQLGVLDHPLSRMMTAEACRHFRLLGNDSSS